MMPFPRTSALLSMHPRGTDSRQRGSEPLFPPQVETISEPWSVTAVIVKNLASFIPALPGTLPLLSTGREILGQSLNTGSVSLQMVPTSLVGLSEGFSELLCPWLTEGAPYVICHSGVQRVNTYQLCDFRQVPSYLCALIFLSVH